MAPLLVQEIEDEPSQSTKIELTPVEDTLRRLLLDVAAYIDKSPGAKSQAHLPNDLAKQGIVLRFAGGWVRDKLLGVDSHDIDVAINKMTGYQFGLRMKEYLEIPGVPEKYGLEGVATTDKQSQKAGISDKSKVVGGLHKIEANPEKSKQLETVKTWVLGLEIDLVNLRKETYSVESRTPQMEFGTPEEDAMRRDATINAMFYNLNTGQIEDLTGRGHHDMRIKLLRTPLDPYETFKDDPLRILRLVRFAPRLGYAIDSKAQVAMRNPEIMDALRQKISRERVGIEIEKALRGPNPHEAMRLIFELGLYDTIFIDPTINPSKHYEPETGGWRTIIDFLEETLSADGTLAEVLVRDDEDRYVAWQLAALVPYNNAPQPEPPEPGRRAPPPSAATVAREGIKSTNKICDMVAAAVHHQSEISGMVDKLYRQKKRADRQVEEEDASARDVLGMAIRRWGPSWRNQAVYAMLVDVASDSSGTEAVERRYTTFVKHLQELDILEAYSFKPLMDGKALAKALDTPPGPWMKDALDVVMAYQLRHPNKANAEEAIAQVKNHNQNAGELTSSLVHDFLKLTIRPLFVKAKPTSVTATGRKNTTTVLPTRLTAEGMDDSVNKPWKNEKDAYALNLLRWCVHSLDGKTLEQVWPLVVPPLLTLVDDWEAKHKQIGAELVGCLLKATSPALLTKTGLGEVFEEALMPCLTFLPSVTPQEESILLLDAVYPALLDLSRTRYSGVDSYTANNKQTDTSRQRVKFLDSIIRKGIIYGYTYCNNYPLIVSTLFNHLVPLLNALGIDSVKHLKYILPMITETLSHPLADAQPETIFSAIKALQAVILNSWPRMAYHRGEVLKGITLCWLNLGKAPNEAVPDAQAHLKETVAMLAAAVQNEVDPASDYMLLLEAEPRLSELLNIEGGSVL